MRPTLLLTVLLVFTAISGCTSTTRHEPKWWGQPAGQEVASKQLYKDQDYCRKKANQEVARRLVGHRPGPEHIKQKRALLIQCMEDKGWVWHGAPKRQRHMGY